MTLPELANANLPLYTLAWCVATALLTSWAYSTWQRYGIHVVHETDNGVRGWRVYLRRTAVGPLRARREAAQADAERLEEEL